MLGAENATDCRMSLHNPMTITLLVDLDGTLLGNALNTFIPAYTQALATRLAEYIEPVKMVRQLMYATSMMAQNQDPQLTLEQVFDQHFYPDLGLKRQDLQKTIDQFYSLDFPRLKEITTFRQEAVDFIRQGIRNGYQFGLATNPLFPHTAILQRLAWAGLPNGETSFQLIPSYESFHFAKPNLEFFAEALGQLGWVNGPVIMVGNDPEMDIEPAKEYGLATFHIVQEAVKQPILSQRHAQGSLAEIIPWISQVSEEHLQPAFKTSSALTANLSAAPAALTSLTRSILVLDWKKRPAPGEWSPTEIICHLRDVEAEVNLSRIERVLQGNNPFIAGRDTDAWTSERNYQEQDGPKALGEFISHRLRLIETVKNLSAQEWDLPARHAIFGPIRLLELIEIITSHDRLHLNTIRQFGM